MKAIYEIHPFYYLLAFICVLTGHFKDLIIFTTIIIAHELGHVITAKIYKWRVEKIKLLPFGALTIFNEDINKPLKEEFIILLMGPLIQILFVFLYTKYDYNLKMIYYSNVILFFNLLPIYPLDGSKFLNIFLNYLFPFKKSHLLTIYISFITIFLVIIKTKFNLILMFSFSFLIYKLYEELLNHKMLFNKFLYERYINNYKFNKRKTIKNIKQMKKDYKHLIFTNTLKTEKEVLSKMFDNI